MLRVVIVQQVLEQPPVGRDAGDGRDDGRQVGRGLGGRPRRVVVVHAVHRAPPEHHLVLRQRARLIAKQVVDLPQLLRDVQRATLHPRIRLRIVHLHVVVYVVHLQQFCHFDRDV